MSAARMTTSARKPRPRPRTVFVIEYDATRDSSRWIVRVGVSIILTFDSQRSALGFMVPHCRDLLDDGVRSQLRLREKDGTWGAERTYPDTTPRQRG
jgi:hypothetical protein